MTVVPSYTEGRVWGGGDARDSSDKTLTLRPQPEVPEFSQKMKIEEQTLKTFELSRSTTKVYVHLQDFLIKRERKGGGSLLKQFVHS